MNLIQELTERGFINQTSADLAEIFDGTKRTIYLGVDPTADSAHAGNFVLYMLLRHLAKAGHNIIMLAGGATGRIGDPKPDVERPLLPPEEIDCRIKRLQTQAKKLINVDELRIVNNYDWFENVTLIDFLRDVGKHFTVGELIKKDAIATRLASDVGLSYTEFAYPLLQGYDFLELHREYGCDLQIGGSDQWGNIVAGVDLVRRKEQVTVYALTVPLVTDKSTGKKFGKSEGNAVWLAGDKTSPYQFYQFWLNVSDESVIEYLKLFSFVSLAEIAEIESQHKINPAARLAQKRLASEVTGLVHSKTEASAVVEASTVLFGGALNDLSDVGRSVLLASAPTYEVSGVESVLEVLVKSGLASSNNEARQFIEGGAVTLGAEKITNEQAVIDVDLFIDGLQILRRGKKQVCVLVLV